MEMPAVAVGPIAALAKAPSSFIPDVIEDDVVDELGLAAPLQQPQRLAPLNEEQRKALLAKGRAAHSGTLSLDTRILIIAGILIVAVVVLVLFYTNIGTARALVREQSVAKTTAQLLAAELKQVLPPPLPATVTHKRATAKRDGGPLEPPVLTVCKAAPAKPSRSSGSAPPKALACSNPHPSLWDELTRMSARNKLLNGARLSFWVIDINGWVYADTKMPGRAFNATTQSFPNDNLYSLSTVTNPQVDDKNNPVPTSVAGVILETAAHGEGIVNFSVPSLGTTNTSVIHVTLFVQPIGGTDFVVAVQVGSKSSLEKGL